MTTTTTSTEVLPARCPSNDKAALGRTGEVAGVKRLPWVAGWSEVCFLPVAHVMEMPGRVVQIDAKAAGLLIADFEKRRTVPTFCGVPVDYVHACEEAAGWVYALHEKRDGLYAAVAWNEAGCAAIESGRFRRVSPGMDMNDFVFSGEFLPFDDSTSPIRKRPSKLLHLSLCNEPLFEMLPPLALPHRRPWARSGWRAAAATFLHGTARRLGGT